MSDVNAPAQLYKTAFGRACISQHSVAWQNKKAVLSQRWPRDAPTKVNKQPHLHLRSR